MGICTWSSLASTHWADLENAQEHDSVYALNGLRRHVVGAQDDFRGRAPVSLVHRWLSGARDHRGTKRRTSRVVGRLLRKWSQFLDEPQCWHRFRPAGLG